MMDKLLGQVNLTSLSFVDHKMLFSTHELKVLKDRIQAYTGKNWIESILSNLDHHEMSCFLSTKHMVAHSLLKKDLASMEKQEFTFYTLGAI